MSEICCDTCGCDIELYEEVACIRGGIVHEDGYMDETDDMVVLCGDCDTAMTKYIRQLGKLKRGAVVEDIDKFLDSIAKHIDIPIE